MNIAVIQNNGVNSERLKRQLKLYERLRETSLNVRFFDKFENFLCRNIYNFDLVFLDAELDRYGGLSAAKKLRETDAYAHIVLMADTVRYALDGYKCGLDAYVLHSDYDGITWAIDKIRDELASVTERPVIMVRQRGAVRKIPYSDIFYIESKGHDIIFHTASGESKVLYKTMRQLEQETRGGGRI